MNSKLGEEMKGSRGGGGGGGGGSLYTNQNDPWAHIPALFMGKEAIIYSICTTLKIHYYFHAALLLFIDIPISVELLRFSCCSLPLSPAISFPPPHALPRNKSTTLISVQ